MLGVPEAEGGHTGLAVRVSRRKVLMHQPGTLNEWLPAKVREFYENQMDTPEKSRRS